MAKFNLFKNALNNKQRTAIKLAKQQQSLGKTAVKELGSTVRNVAATLATSKSYQRGKESEVAKERAKLSNISNIQDAINKYNAIINGQPASTGNTQTGSTTDIESSYGGK